jgi:hypothetical protein
MTASVRTDLLSIKRLWLIHLRVGKRARPVRMRVDDAQWIASKRLMSNNMNLFFVAETE